MKRLAKYLAGTLSVLVVLLIGFLFFARSQNPSFAIKEGTLAPGFVATGHNGEKIDLSQYRGRYVLLDFWHTRCGPCIQDTPQLVSLQEKYGRQELVILAISSDENRRDVERYVRRYNASWVQILDIVDNGGLLTDLYSISLYPTYYLIDKEGYIVLSGIGVVDRLEEEGLQARRNWVGRLLFDFFHLG